MEGKKIAFIVVAIATVGGIGYYLYKKNKVSIVNAPTVNAPIVSSVSLEEKAKAKAKASAEASARMKSTALQTGKTDINKYKTVDVKTLAYPKNLYE